MARQSGSDSAATGGLSRRDFLKSAASVSAAAAAMGAAPTAMAEAAPPRPIHGKKPNVILYVADQMRWDFIRAYGLNSTTRTPNLDSVFRRGVAFTGAVTNQPLCSPSRACMMTGRYATETGMWRLDQTLNPSLPTLATEFRSHGYTANFVGKWHLAPANPAIHSGRGFVKPEDRAGFLDFWEGSNQLEWTSHPYSGTIWDGAGNPITWKDEYRVDFLTDRAVRFLKQPQEKPFLLFISQLEPHFQNDLGRPVAPKGYAERFQNPFVPADLLHRPGDWQAQLPDYYGCIESIDQSVGRILETLDKIGQLDNTVFLFSSDHGCHFRTRNREYKRSPHDDSIRVPWVMQGPGLDLGVAVPEIFGNTCMTPTLLDAAGFKAPASMKGRSVLPLLHDPKAREQWPNQALIQVSESMVGRAIRTREWTYCVAARGLDGRKIESSDHYDEYQMYNNFDDPAQLVNLAARVPYLKDAEMLRGKLLDAIAASGEPRPTITPATLYP